MTQASPEQLTSLIQRMASRDERAFAEFYDATSASIFGLLMRMLGERSKAEEVTQNVYLEVWRKASSFDADRGSGWSWLVLLARSRAIDAARSDRSYDSAISELEATPGAHPSGRRTVLPDQHAELSERRDLVRDAMESLSEEQRETLRAAYFHGWSHREIADRTGVPLGTVKGRIRSGLSVLEGVLGPRMGRAEGRGES